MKITAKLRQHQRHMVDYAMGLFTEGNPNKPVDAPDGDFCWWYAGCRTGKTLASIVVAKELDIKRILVLTKKAAMIDAWKHDLDTFTEDADYLILGDKVLTPTHEEKGKKKALLKARYMLDYLKNTQKPCFVVINYESARIIADKLVMAQFDLVIADESHALKSAKSKQSKIFAKALRDVPYKLIMTGTGWDDRITDVYGQVRFLAPVVRGRGMPISAHLGTWDSFFNRHVNYYQMEHIKIPNKRNPYKNQDKLQETLNDFTLVVDSREVLDLPEEEHIHVNLPMPKVMRNVYYEFEEEMVATFGETILQAGNKLVQSLRLHQLTSGYYPDEDGNPQPLMPVSKNPKLQALLDVLDEIGQAPIVVFTRFRHDVKLITELLEKNGNTYKLLTGDKHENVEWQAGDGQVLIANIQAGGTGISLNRARYCVYYSVGNSRTDYEQSLWRIRAQPDPSKPISYWHFCILNSIDIEIQRGLEGKGDMSEYLLNGLVNRIHKDD